MKGEEATREPGEVGEQTEVALPSENSPRRLYPGCRFLRSPACTAEASVKLFFMLPEVQLSSLKSLALKSRTGHKFTHSMRTEIHYVAPFSSAL